MKHPNRFPPYLGLDALLLFLAALALAAVVTAVGFVAGVVVAWVMG